MWFPRSAVYGTLQRYSQTSSVCAVAKPNRHQHKLVSLRWYLLVSALTQQYLSDSDNIFYCFPVCASGLHMNCERMATGKVMSGRVLVAAYMSDLIPCWYGTFSMSCVSECVEGDWSVDRIAPAVMGIEVGFASWRLKRLRIVLIYAFCESMMVCFVQSHSTFNPNNQVSSPRLEISNHSLIIYTQHKPRSAPKAGIMQR
jgi:hypothetical protein